MVYDLSVLSNPLTWILLITLIVSIVTQVSFNAAIIRSSLKLTDLQSFRVVKNLLKTFYCRTKLITFT